MDAKTYTRQEAIVIRFVVDKIAYTDTWAKVHDEWQHCCCHEADWLDEPDGEINESLLDDFQGSE